MDLFRWFVTARLDITNRFTLLQFRMQYLYLTLFILILRMEIELSNVFVFLATCAFGFLLWVAKYLFDRSQLHETRIQAVENIQGTKLDQLEKKIDKIELSIENLLKSINKENDQEGKLSTAIQQLYHFLEKNNK